MFCHGGRMQIAGSNLLLAAQAAQQAQRAKPVAAPAVAAATAPPAQFEPMTFAKGSASEMPKAQAASPQPGTILRPGSQLDIRI